MTTLQHKIDFAILFSVKNANPNGDPLNGNRPRTDYSGFGEITDVCLKRKIRDRLVERYQNLAEDKRNGQAIFVQSDDRKIDDCKSLKARAEATLGNKLGSSDTVKLACENWIDVRAFGQLFAYKGKKMDESVGDTGVSIAIRGPVTIQSAFSLKPVDITSTQITKSVSGEGDGTKRGSDTMGMKHRVDHGIYVCYGSMNPQLAERTGFSNEDAEVIKDILPKLFENDASSARPEGSMEVLKVVWWKQQKDTLQYSSAKVHGALANLLINKNENFDESELVKSLAGLVPEIKSGF
ncbi:MAG: type I-C CRISPR-associated protein Cas7/Csd2 [Proteobacteria bacterium]|nr:type I-C CRISPR-associated protein Cas7/Csd2 [Pseudomonadota bacterium]